MKMHIVNRLSRYPVIESTPKSARTSKSAAVLIILKDLEKEPSLILTKRAANLRHHAGQVAFPGGMWESGDKSLTETALREASEEIGLSRESVEIIAMLPPASPWRRDIDVTPFVSTAVGDLDLTANPDEIESIFDVPLKAFLDMDSYDFIEFGSDSGQSDADIKLPVLVYNKNKIWGFTLKVITDLIEQVMDVSMAKIWSKIH